ncbi:hypothetical protein F5Y16DRAFT_403661 [Xylariaceae sp. FL0255]|nr:hypothetical protein F5Y16DRAFT_403661 [Xylariaceae sp. FL0255]
MLPVLLLLFSAVSAAQSIVWEDWSDPLVQRSADGGTWELHVAGCVKNGGDCEPNQPSQNFTLDLNLCVANVVGYLMPDANGGFASTCTDCGMKAYPYEDAMSCSCEAQLGTNTDNGMWITPYWGSHGNFIVADSNGVPTCFNHTAEAGEIISWSAALTTTESFTSIAQSTSAAYSSITTTLQSTEPSTTTATPTSTTPTFTTTTMTTIPSTTTTATST